MHLPFVMSYVLAASTLSRLVLAHDCSNADPETLGEDFIGRSVEHVDQALRWYYCGGIGMALICMSILSLCHIHKRLPKARLLKRPRLVIRVFCAITIICLPLATSLTSLDLIAITTSLVVFVLALDLYGNSSQGDAFWTGGLCKEARKNCPYTADCKLGRQRREQLQKAMARGEKVGLADLLKRHGSMSSVGTETSRDEEWQGHL